MNYDSELDNFHDLPALLDAISEQRPIRDGDVVVAIVRDPQGTQEIISLDVLNHSAYLEDFQDATESIYHLMQEAPITEADERDMTCRPLTLMGRRGYAIFTRWESAWTCAWKYSNHGRRTWTSDFVVVTEHGWFDLMTESGGRLPALVAP